MPVYRFFVPDDPVQHEVIAEEWIRLGRTVDFLNVTSRDGNPTPPCPEGFTEQVLCLTATVVGSVECSYETTASRQVPKAASTSDDAWAR
jgi:hypothetical protein